MGTNWTSFEDHMCSLGDHARTYTLSDFSMVVKNRLTFMVADNLRTIVSAMVLVGRLDDARFFAAEAEKYARIAIERRHRFFDRKNIPLDQAMDRCWSVVYECRWLLDGKEDFDLLRRGVPHNKAALEAIADKPRQRRLFEALKARAADHAARLGDFTLAVEMCPDSDGPINWNNGFGHGAEERLLCKTVRYLGKIDATLAYRKEIVAGYQSLFEHLRSGAIDPTQELFFLDASYVAYHGLRHFEELRRGRPFNYEEVMRSVRYG